MENSGESFGKVVWRNRDFCIMNLLGQGRMICGFYGLETGEEAIVIETVSVWAWNDGPEIWKEGEPTWGMVGR